MKLPTTASPRGLEARWTVYMLECRNHSLYVGATTDLGRRIVEHNRGRGARYTAAHRPVRLVHAESHPTQSSAARREAELKRLTHLQKLALLASCAPH